MIKVAVCYDYFSVYEGSYLSGKLDRKYSSVDEPVSRIGKLREASCILARRNVLRKKGRKWQDLVAERASQCEEVLVKFNCVRNCIKGIQFLLLYNYINK